MESADFNSIRALLLDLFLDSINANEIEILLSTNYHIKRYKSKLTRI